MEPHSPPFRPLAVITDATHPVGQKIAHHFIQNGYALFLGKHSPPFLHEMRERYRDVEIRTYERPFLDSVDVNLFYEEIASLRRPVEALALSDQLGESNGIQIFLSSKARKAADARGDSSASFSQHPDECPQVRDNPAHLALDLFL